MDPASGFPSTRLRRLRYHPAVRNLIRETRLAPASLVLPLFARTGKNVRQPIGSMPGHAQLSVDLIAVEAREAVKLGLGGIILFGIPAEKDAVGRDSYNDAGIVQQAVRAAKDAAPELLVITDVCFCEYTDHGHCGVIDDRTGRMDVNNDATLELLGKQAVSHAAAGADIVAPSGMMDGMVRAIRAALDGGGHQHVPILSYAAKYASAFYGPFRDAIGSAKTLTGDKRTYQMDSANSDEALREVELDIAEGADMVMVKPGMPYLDIVRRVKDTFAMPTFVYQVSGEYAMIAAAGGNGWIDGERAMMESLTAFKRAGADGILTYFAPKAAEKIKAES
jgi:porphobilinogen synthase